MESPLFGALVLLSFAIGHAVPIVLGASAIGWLENVKPLATYQHLFDIVGGIAVDAELRLHRTMSERSDTVYYKLSSDLSTRPFLPICAIAPPMATPTSAPISIIPISTPNLSGIVVNRPMSAPTAIPTQRGSFFM